MQARLLPERTVCYRCSAEYRGAAPNPDHRPFDLHVDDVVRRQQHQDWIAAEDALAGREPEAHPGEEPGTPA